MKLGIYELEVDAERTRKFYHRNGGISCDCDGCQNFTKAISQLPDPVKAFLDQFGIDPAKPAELSAIYAPSDDTVFYDGFYHICGTILQGTEPYIQIGEKHFQLDTKYSIELDAENSVFFSNDVHLLDDNFPKPVFQMNVFFTLPWVLPKPNPYN